MALTLFGKAVRKMRIERDESCAEMASKLGVTSSWLSQIELGRRKPPRALINQIVDIYGLGKEKATTLKALASLSKMEMVVTPKTLQQATVAVRFAEKLSGLTPTQLANIEAELT